MNSVRIREAAVSMNMVDGDALTPMQMSRIVTAVLAELRRCQDEERSREQDTRLASSGPPGHDLGRRA